MFKSWLMQIYPNFKTESANILPLETHYSASPMRLQNGLSNRGAELGS
jgi:hypothetical protein